MQFLAGRRILDGARAAGADEADGPRIPLPEARRVSELIRPALPRLAIFGAGHLGQAVARAMEPLPFHVDWLASRDDLRPEASGVGATILSDDELEEAIDAAPAGTFVAIFTHSHDLDYRLVRAALRRDDLAYVGLIGSRTKRARFEDRLKDDGISAAQIARLSCPIGIPTLKGKAPAVIAVAVAAELLQLAGDAPE